MFEQIYQYVSTYYRPEEFPVLAQQIQDWRLSQPLKGIRILDATPLFTNTLVKFLPLLIAGAKLTVAVSDKILFDATLLPLLKQWGVPYQYNITKGDYDIIQDCGGVHSKINPHVGTVELTRSGLYYYQRSDFPVILVDDSRIKCIETCLGTGDGFMRGMQSAGYQDWKGRPIVIFGYGKVGRGVAYYCHRYGAKITVIDKMANSLPDYVSWIDVQDSEGIRQAVRQAWCIITATGIKHALAGNPAIQEILSGNQLVAAIGIEDEWGEELPMDRRLFHGKTVNFLLHEPTRLRYIDGTMALSNAAALELLQKTLPSGINRIDADVEELYWRKVKASSLISAEIEGMNL